MGRPRPLTAASIDPIVEEPSHALSQLWNHNHWHLTERTVVESQRGA
jgi:hypothetical protein